MFFRNLAVATAALALFPAGACSSSTSVVSCVPGSSQLCACTSGATGSQTCSAAGDLAVTFRGAHVRSST